MYIPKQFEMPQADVLDFIKGNPFGVIVSAANSDIRATHIPFEIKHTESSFSLLGHIAAANPHCEYLSQDIEHLIVLNGPHSYVSASWYKNINVPTWNYQAVHVYGKIRVMTKTELKAVLADMLTNYESGRENAVTIERVPDKMMDAYLDEIVGFEFIPTKVQAKSKLSQNRTKGDYHSVMSHLEAQPDLGSQSVAAEMKRRKF